MGLKAELNLSREGFDKMLAVFGTMLPEKHTLPTNLYEAEKLLRMLFEEGLPRGPRQRFFFKKK